jgi:hypothetical protein
MVVEGPKACCLSAHDNNKSQSSSRAGSGMRPGVDGRDRAHWSRARKLESRTEFSASMLTMLLRRAACWYPTTEARSQAPGDKAGQREAW